MAEVGTKVGEDKGINFPDTEMRFPPLTSKDVGDLRYLRFIVDHADMVDYSFVRTSDDLKML